MQHSISDFLFYELPTARKCFINFFPTDASALRDVFVTVPQAVNVGDTVTLQCGYDLEGEALYMVKWYKGPREFFRYIPKEMPSTQVFPYPGINVDVSMHVNQIQIIHLKLSVACYS